MPRYYVATHGRTDLFHSTAGQSPMSWFDEYCLNTFSFQEPAFWEQGLVTNHCGCWNANSPRSNHEAVFLTLISISNTEYTRDFWPGFLVLFIKIEGFSSSTLLRLYWFRLGPHTSVFRELIFFLCPIQIPSIFFLCCFFFFLQRKQEHMEFFF